MEGCYALSIYFAKKHAFIHFVIAPEDGGYQIRDSPDAIVYKSINELVSSSMVLENCQPIGVGKSELIN